MDKLTIISGCLFLAADIFAIASLANPDWINTGESAGALTVGLVRQCQTIHGRDRTCVPPRLPPEWVTTLFFIIMGIISLTVTCGLLVASHWRRETTKYARWIAFAGSPSSMLALTIRLWSCDPILHGSPHLSDWILHQRSWWPAIQATQ
ncbi:uncharacterized protein C16orf52 homolog B isoform X2 [Hemitrygon akajei]|uniref:uncharacterized protein C16orf52 homolog B isoform X2 n=1 Tax=Hemitrygon akajei TaxID=2704970 RepID=UPI003BF9E2A7